MGGRGADTQPCAALTCRPMSFAAPLRPWSGLPSALQRHCWCLARLGPNTLFNWHESGLMVQLTSETSLELSLLYTLLVKYDFEIKHET